jgi:hypothetical protein
LRGVTPLALRIRANPQEKQMTVDLRQVFDAYRHAVERPRRRPIHSDRGQTGARGHAAEGRFHMAVDALEAAEKRWEQVRLAHLARLEMGEP